jgi:soluble lytic murein transglycosylase-like protein
VRYEPTYRWLVGDKLNMSLTERHTQMCSWGLMQVMGGTARELGLTGYLSQLCDPETGVQYGCRYLRRLFERYQIWDDAIAAYNAGSPRRVGPTYVNQGYVDKVNGYWQQADGQKNTV